MSSNLHFSLITPERTVLSQELESLSCPTPDGQITILPHHAPLISEIATGELIARSKDGESVIFIAGGFLEVKKDGRVIALADAAEHSSEIDMKRAEVAKARAEEAMKQQHVYDEEFALTSAALERSLGRLTIARKHSHRKNPLADQGTFNE